MNPHTIFVVSGGVGSSGEQLVQTVLAQFPRSAVSVVIVAHVRSEHQIEEVISQAKAAPAQVTITYTLVDPLLRAYMTRRCQQEDVSAVDLMGALFTRLEQALERPSLGQPGLYRQLNKDYFERVAAMEFTMANDDGKDPEKWSQADILLVGISRVGKTPLSLYLSVMGWKTANLPLIPGIEPPKALARLDPQRVIGLTIQPGQLIALRQERQRRMGSIGPGSYTDPQTILEEVEYARKFCKQRGYTLIDVTDKPVESSADEVIRLITARFQPGDRQG